MYIFKIIITKIIQLFNVNKYKIKRKEALKKKPKDDGQSFANLIADQILSANNSSKFS